MSAPANAEIQRLGSATYLSLTTFRRDGTPVATPVWASQDGDRLYVWTEADAGKVKRVRSNGAVVLGSADDVDRLRSLHRAKYGLRFRLFDGFASVFRRSRGHVVIEISIP
jgi:predicted pyridoxine 5'-phosphate oxidase superfamily flavin-nucleotide-binding protein